MALCGPFIILLRPTNHFPWHLSVRFIHNIHCFYWLNKQVAFFEYNIQTLKQWTENFWWHVRAERIVGTCGWDSMSRLQEHIFPSVEMLMRLWAFCVPTTLTQYTGCWKRQKSKVSVKNNNKTNLNNKQDITVLISQGSWTAATASPHLLCGVWRHVPCGPQQREVSSGQECVCYFCCPTGRSVLSKCLRQPG